MRQLIFDMNMLTSILPLRTALGPHTLRLLLLITRAIAMKMIKREMTTVVRKQMGLVAATETAKGKGKPGGKKRKELNRHHRPRLIRMLMVWVVDFGSMRTQTKMVVRLGKTRMHWDASQINDRHPSGEEQRPLAALTEMRMEAAELKGLNASKNSIMNLMKCHDTINTSLIS